MTEDEWRTQIVEPLLVMRGYELRHIGQPTIQFADGRRVGDFSVRGIPDLVAWKPDADPRLLAIELKGERTKLQPHQQQLLDEWDGLIVQSMVWRLGVTSEEAIVRELMTR